MLGTFSPVFFVLGGELRELSLFVDESGSDNLRDRYYLLTLVLHEQDEDVSKSIHLYSVRSPRRVCPTSRSMPPCC